MTANNDQVYSPSHYNSGAIEVICYIEDNGWAEGFCLGNCIKYLSRKGKKPGEGEIKDLLKAKWYLDRYLDYVQTTDSDRRSKLAQEILNGKDE